MHVMARDHGTNRDSLCLVWYPHCVTLCIRGKLVSQDEPKDVKELPKPKPGAPVRKLNYGAVGRNIGLNSGASEAPSAIIQVTGLLDISCNLG